MPLPDDLFANVEGHISLAEAELLYSLACAVPAGSNVFEIGSYKGRSTVALALGAKEAGAIVYAVDPHPTYEVGGTLFSMADNQAYYASIAKYGVGDVVKTINLPSRRLWFAWESLADSIALLFIDGSHEYEDVHHDFHLWAMFASTIALHDTAGFHPGVTRLVEEILAAGIWECVQQVDALSVFKRVE